MRDVSLRAAAGGPGVGPPDLAARRAMPAPALLGLLISTALVLLGPWPFQHRLVLGGCILAGGGCVTLEFFVPWEQLSARTYLLLPAAGLLVIGAGMWASGGWSSPFTPFLTLPAAYAVAATNFPSSLPIAALAGLVAASPGLYTAHTSFLVVVLGAVPAYTALVGVIGVIMNHLRSSDRSAALEAEARRQSELRAQDLLTLQHVSAIVAAHLGMDDAIRAIVHELSVAFGHSLISLYLVEDGLLKMQAQVGYDTYYETLQPGVGVIGTAYRGGRTIFIRDTAADGLYMEAEADVASEIAVPLFHEGGAVGVLNVESSAPLTDRDRDLMELFGSQVSVVLRNARLAGELRLRAEQDSLTGLLNHRALVEKLQHTLQSGTDACAVLLIDLNNFKQINDTYGHLVGDDMLRYVADTLTASCRAEDYCGRCGGDEFVLVLPGADRSQASAIVSRINGALRDLPYCLPDHSPVPLALSVGLAATPDDGTTWQELFSHADAFMYCDKRFPAGVR